MTTKMELKVKIAGLVAAKVELTRERVAIKRKSFQERTAAEHSHMLALWGYAATKKDEIRHALLAYAFVSGRRYWTVERLFGADNAPSESAIAWWADAPAADIRAWLDAPVSSEEIAGYQNKVDEASKRARAAREARRKAREAA